MAWQRPQQLEFHDFQNGPCQIIGQPGGLRTCLFVTLCLPCAAGEVSSRSGGSYCVDCCLGPCTLTSSCVWACSRSRLKNKLGIDVGVKGLYPCDVAVMCVWAPCLLCQELNELDAHTPPKRQYVVPFPQSMSTPLVQQQMDVFAYGPAPPSPLVPTYSA